VTELPLFPLRTVLFPDGLLELRVFEARYLDLMSRCLRERSPFGVVALRSGTEVRRGADDSTQLYDVGTLAELIEVESAQAGILQVRCRGRQRFALGRTRQERDGLWLAATTPIADDAAVPPAPDRSMLVEGLVEAIAALAAQGATPFLEPHRFDDAGWVANRWCELLPMPLEVRQRLMAFADPLARLEAVDSLMRVKHDPH
jgi:Lon protease-like protein